MPTYRLGFLPPAAQNPRTAAWYVKRDQGCAAEMLDPWLLRRAWGARAGQRDKAWREQGPKAKDLDRNFAVLRDPHMIPCGEPGAPCAWLHMQPPFGIPSPGCPPSGSAPSGGGPPCGRG